MTNTTATTAPAPTTSATAPEPRVLFAQQAPKAFKALLAFDAAAREGLDPVLVELVLIRASQLNGCAYCLHMHTSDARKAGESDERMHMVAVWHEAAHFFTPAEQAALALTEAITRISGSVPDEVYARAAAEFDEPTLARLIALICAINTWNRVALATGKVAGTDERR
ncbi:carboxymuconolactone decarboxylase family protein [Kitasatospora viridis]|uniref:AhpD family alkylhydroperoxidase n=1 Tax=Kitasatospora viridis TaxID=281105 RepID=A0A561UI73_9ACTN|nr:carboxymuconolactone decarboxylase family protein [Kitasatospora viridis]TWF99055.1 AhpD family alkylhydroperoxidase [Kitasatospora viridis]